MKLYIAKQHDADQHRNEAGMRLCGNEAGMRLCGNAAVAFCDFEEKSGRRSGWLWESRVGANRAGNTIRKIAGGQ